MHPTVRLEDPNAKCPICFMDLIPVMNNDGGEGMEMRLTLSPAAKEMSKIENRQGRTLLSVRRESALRQNSFMTKPQWPD